MNKNNKTCAFTGHRLHKLPGGRCENTRVRVELIDRIETVILTLIEKMEVTHFVTGMAVGIDMYAAECVLRLKWKYPEITIEAAIPCRGQEKKWSKSQQEKYNHILSMCDRVTYLQDEYTKNCMMKRNMYMVDKADILLAVWDESSGGTGNTVNYALSLKKKGLDKTILRIDPNTLCLETVIPESYDGQIKLL